MESIIKKFWPFRYLSETSKMDENSVEFSASNLLKTLHTWESKLMTLQSLLIWERPKYTIAAFFIYSVFFWLLTFISINLLTKVCIITLVLFISHEWVTLIWPEISIPHEAEEDWTTLHPNIMSVNELNIYIENNYTRIFTLCEQVAIYRKQNSGKFCTISIGLFCALFTVGNMVPGCVLLYLGITFIAAIPGLMLHLDPPPLFRWICGFFCSYFVIFIKDFNISGRSDLEEFLPQANASVIRESLEIGIPEDKESDSTDLLSGRNSAHSFSCSSDDDDSFAPMPAPPVQLQRSHQANGSDMQHVTDETELMSEAQAFEDQLVAGLADQAGNPSSEGIDELSAGKLTWFNKALYTQMLDNFFKRSNDESNSGDSS